LNEAFLSTAQLRSSVVSHAATLGYIPRSRTASRAEVKLSVNLSGVANRPGSIVLGAGTTFTADAGDTTYTREFTLTVAAPVITTYTSTGSGTFSVPTGASSVDVLVVAGGGSGGNRNSPSGTDGGGGGGAG